MGILDNIIGSLVGGSGGASPGMGNVLSNILGGSASAGTQQGGGATTGGATGGIGGLISMFEQAGLGDVVQSWIGTGSNKSVSPQDLQNVFGDRVHGMAQQAGMNSGDFLSQLSQHLPKAVDGMTPDGRVPNQSYDV